jgi:hypothetical protein
LGHRQGDRLPQLLLAGELIAKLSVTVESKPGKGQEFLFLGPFSGPEVIFH